MSKRALFPFIAGVAIGSSSFAYGACTAPSGTYTGSGAGYSVLSTNTGSNTTAGYFISQAFSVVFGAPTATAMPAGTFILIQKQITQPTSGVSTGSYFMVTDGAIASQTIAAGTPSWGTVNRFTTTTCTGFMTLTGSVVATPVGTTTPSPGVGRFNQVWLYTSSESGNVITMSPFDSTATGAAYSTNGYVVELRKK